jgi:hypothetical protein
MNYVQFYGKNSLELIERGKNGCHRFVVLCEFF